MSGFHGLLRNTSETIHSHTHIRFQRLRLVIKMKFEVKKLVNYRKMLPALHLLHNYQTVTYTTKVNQR